VDFVTVTVGAAPEPDAGPTRSGSPPPPDPEEEETAEADEAPQLSDPVMIPDATLTNTKVAGRDAGGGTDGQGDRQADAAGKSRTDSPDDAASNDRTAAGDPRLQVEAGDGRTVHGGTLVRLQADVSDQYGRVPSARWTQVGGPPVALEGSNTMSPSFIAPSGGQAVELVFRVEVSDGSSTDSDVVAVTVLAQTSNSSQPAALLVAEGGDTVRLDPLESSVPLPEGADLTYSWTQVGGTSVELGGATGASPVIELPEVFVQEDLVFQVKISAGGQQTTQQLTVRVEPVEDVSRAALAGGALMQQSADAADSVEEARSPGVGKVWAALLAFLQTGRSRSRE
jgi:hypothetical protein